ncbi:unnamed protein product, partial [marine sediment metagenome]
MIKNKPNSPTFTLTYYNPQKREITLNSEARGVLFKENLLPQWRAYYIFDNDEIEVEILFAGPGFMYVPLDLDKELPKAIRFE